MTDQCPAAPEQDRGGQRREAMTAEQGVVAGERQPGGSAGCENGGQKERALRGTKAQLNSRRGDSSAERRSVKSPAVSNSPQERRKVERVKLLRPIPGQVGTARVFVIEAGLDGFRIAHEGILPPSGKTFRLE